MTRELIKGGKTPARRATALQAAAEQMATLKPEWQRVIDHVYHAAGQMLQAFVDSHPNIANELVELNAARDELALAYQSKLGMPAPSGYGGAAGPSSVWISEARRVMDRLNTESVPWTQGRRDAWKRDLGMAVGSLMSTYEPTFRGVAEGAWQKMRQKGAKQAAAIQQSATKSCPKFFEPPPPIGPRRDPMDPRQPDSVGPGPLNFRLGYLMAGWLNFSTTSYGEYQTAAEQFDMPPVGVPVVIDLDAVGALVIDDRRCIEGGVLNLLSALPANQFLLKIFDPEHGGDSAKFLFGLGDAGERIIGDRVKTSDRELGDLLQSTEEHITFVTQRFLQGEHKSLTEYNRAAGEVAEPYQLMVLYDFPSGFSRAGRFDEDQLDRLGKIIRNGPRSGVFTILVVSAATLQSLLEPPDQPQPNASIEKVVLPLPWFLNGPVEPSTLDELGRGSKLSIWTTVDAPAALGASVGSAELTWRFEPANPPDPAVAASQLDAVKRNIHSARDVQVTPERVAELLEQIQRSDSAALGEQSRQTVAYPDQPRTWWRASSARAVVAHFGRIGARQVADLALDSGDNYGALIGGRPGSGKSVLIHSVIMSIVTEYAPSEVELCLIDFKEGVEFKLYAEIGLPHARVIAIESERDFGLSVLQRAASEITRRGELFRSTGGETLDLAQYRARTGQPLKRLVLIIDEFQHLFYRDDKIAGESAEILEVILRKGRAFGIHLVLASQSLAGMASLGRHVLGFIPTRIALQSNEADSRLILGEDNPDARTLVRAGEGILNRKLGQKDANQRFQAVFWDPDARSDLLRKVVDRARVDRYPDITTVFEGHKPADVTNIEPRTLVPVPDANFSGVAVPVGLPLTLDAEPLFARLRREAGSNMLIVDEHGEGSVAIVVSSLRQQGATIDLLDFVGDDDGWMTLRGQLESLPGITIHGRRRMVEALSGLAAEIDQRHSVNDYKNTPRVLVIAGMGRARDFDPNDSYNEEAPSHILGRIVRDGPEVGVFVVAWFDRPAGMSKRLERQQIKEFGQILLTQVSRDDSSMLIDSDSAAGLKPGQGVLADVDRSTEHKVRTLSTPSAEWFARFNEGVRTG